MVKSNNQFIFPGKWTQLLYFQERYASKEKELENFVCVKGNGLSDFSLYFGLHSILKTLKKIIFEYQMMRGKRFFHLLVLPLVLLGGSCTTLRHLPFWVGLSFKLRSCLTAFLWENALKFLVCDSTGQHRDSRFRAEFYESSMYKTSSGFI